MTAGDEGWAFSGFKIVVDPDAPPGGVFLRSGLEQGIIPAVDYAAVLRQLEADPVKGPLVAEDLASLAESAPFLIRTGEREGPSRCESCGTDVVAVPESPVKGERRWARAIWEDRLFRKHTLRRCEWRRREASRKLVD